MIHFVDVRGGLTFGLGGQYGRLFKIKEYRIPLYLYFELYLSLFFAFLSVNKVFLPIICIIISFLQEKST